MTALDTLREILADRYVIEREVGSGGMATVYLARDAKHHRRVAIKVLDPELGAVIGADRFLAEIQVTANLQHPNLLPLFDSGEAAGLLYYVMPYVEGESLRARLNRERQLPVGEAVRIATAVASALEGAAWQCSSGPPRDEPQRQGPQRLQPELRHRLRAVWNAPSRTVIRSTR